MKIRLTFKDPDGVDYSLSEYVDAKMNELIASGKYEGDERDYVKEDAIEVLSNAISPWVNCGEYVTIEIDTETNTAVVIRS